MDSADCFAFMGGLSYHTSCLDIEKFFKQHHYNVKKFNLRMGYAFVYFYNQFEADRAIALLNGKLLMGKAVRLEHPRRDSGTNSHVDEPSQFTYRLKIANLSPSVSLQDLKHFLQQAGKVEYVDARKYHARQGIVHFSTYREMMNAHTTLNGKLLHDEYIVLHSPSAINQRQTMVSHHQNDYSPSNRPKFWSNYDSELFRPKHCSPIRDSRFDAYTIKYRYRHTSKDSYVNESEIKYSYKTRTSRLSLREERLKPRSRSRTTKRRRSPSSEYRSPVAKKCRSEYAARYSKEERKKRISRSRSPIDTRKSDLKKHNFPRYKSSSSKCLKKKSKHSSSSSNRKKSHLNYQTRNTSPSSSRNLHYAGDGLLNSAKIDRTKQCTKYCGTREENRKKREVDKSVSKAKIIRVSRPSLHSSSSSTKPMLPISPRPIPPYDIPKTPSPSLSPRPTPETNYKQRSPAVMATRPSLSPSYSLLPELAKKTGKLYVSSNWPSDYEIPKTPSPTPTRLPNSTSKLNVKQELGLRDKIDRPKSSFTNNSSPELTNRTGKNKSSKRPGSEKIKNDCDHDYENNGKHSVIIGDAGFISNSTYRPSSYKTIYDETSSRSSSSSSSSTSDSSSTSESSESSSSSSSESESSSSKPAVLHLSIGENSLVHTSDNEDKDSALGVSEIKHELLSK